MLYSYKGGEPKPLPSRIRFDNGLTRTSLNELSNEELQSFGFLGPIEIPDYDVSTQKIFWNGISYEVIDLTEEEIVERGKSYVTNENYISFWHTLQSLPVYKKIRTEASNRLEVNAVAIEFISNLNDAKYNNINVELIQNSLNLFFLMIEFDSDEIRQFSDLLESTKLNYFYTLPDLNYIQTHVYDPNTNTIVPLQVNTPISIADPLNISGLSSSTSTFSIDNSQPYPSWTWDGERWVPPVPWPVDAEKTGDYTWNEQTQSWDPNN